MATAARQITLAMPTVRQLGTDSMRYVRSARPTWTVASGRKSKTTSSAIEGIAVGSWAHCPPNCKNVLEKETTRPSSSAPR